MSKNSEQRSQERKERQKRRQQRRTQRGGRQGDNNPTNPGTAGNTPGNGTSQGGQQSNQQGGTQNNNQNQNQNQNNTPPTSSRRTQRRRQRGNSPTNPGTGGTTPGNGTSQGGQQGNQQGGTQNNNPNNTPSTPSRGPIPGETPDFDGQSHAYKFNLPHRKKQQDEKAPQKGASGDGYKPYKPEWSKFKEDDKKLIMEYLGDLFQYVFLECPLDAITNTTIVAIDWFLYAPFSGGADEPKIKEKKNKTILDYRDDVRDEYTAKAKAGLKISSQAHKELKDNIENAKNGLPTTWKEWGGEPACFRSFVDLAQKAEADPNSEEAKRWKQFEKFPEKMERVLQKENVLRYFSLTLAAADAIINPQDTEIPKGVSKKIDELSNITSKSSDIATLEDNISKKITEIRALTTGGKPIDSAISENLDEIQHIISGQNNDIDKIKKDLNKKIKELKNVNAFPKKIKANSQAYYDSMSDNIDKILEVYKNQPAEATKKVREYMEQIKNTVDSTEKETETYIKENSFDIKKLRRNKVKKRIDSAKEAINQFDLEGKPINQRQQASEKHPCPFSAGKQAILNSIARCFGS